MADQTFNFFISWFSNWNMLGLGLAITFGTFWLTGYWPPLFKRYWLWAVILSSAILTLAAASFIQLPLQILAGQILGYFWNQETIMRRLLLAGIPQILLSGLVQEGAKLVPVVVWWWRSNRNIDPKLGLVIGAVAGAGFGTFEAVWAHNLIFASGWSWEALHTGGFMALAGFWERFFVVAFHTASCALAGWGLAKGWGWQFYLIASLAHAFINYSVVLLQSGIFTPVQMEIFAAVWAVMLTTMALWLRWRKQVDEAELES